MLLFNFLFDEIIFDFFKNVFKISGKKFFLNGKVQMGKSRCESLDTRFHHYF